MTIQKMTPELEHDYLKSYGMTSTVMACAIMLITLISVFDSVLESMGLNILATLAVIIVLMLAVMVVVNKEATSSIFMFSKQAWVGTYEDEFLNLVNMRAFKTGFFVCQIAFGAGILGLFDGIPVDGRELFTGLFGLSMLSYGVTVQVGLREDDE